MSTRRKSCRLLALLAVTGFLSACGSQSYRDLSSVQDPGMIPYEADMDPTDTATPTPTPSPVATASAPPIATSFQIVGHLETQADSKVTLTAPATDNILVVRITAGPSGGTLTPTNFPATYGCATYRVTAIGKVVTTPVLSVGDFHPNCPTAPNSTVISFSDRLGSGHESVDIKIDNVMTDARFSHCMWNPMAYWPNSCIGLWPYKLALNYDARMNGFTGAHIATGTIEIQVNGTGGF